MEVPKCIRIYIANNRFAIYTIFYLQIALFKMQRRLLHWDTTWFRISQIHLIGVTTMRNVGDSLCCWQAWDVSDGFFISKKLYQYYQYNEKVVINTAVIRWWCHNWFQGYAAKLVQSQIVNLAWNYFHCFLALLFFLYF